MSATPKRPTATASTSRLSAGLLPSPFHIKPFDVSVGPGLDHLAMGQNPIPPVNPLKWSKKWVVHLLQNGTIGFDPQPFALFKGTLSSSST